MEVAEKKLSWDHDGSIATEGEVLDFIFALIRATKPSVCLETGTFRGHGTAAIVNGLNANEHGFLWTVEASEDMAEALSRAETLPDRVEFVHGDSLTFCKDFDKPIDFAFVDCGEAPHRLKVLAAIEPQMASDSILCLHDSIFHGPDFVRNAESILGPAQLHLKTLHGLLVWQWR